MVNKMSVVEIIVVTYHFGNHMYNASNGLCYWKCVIINFKIDSSLLIKIVHLLCAETQVSKNAVLVLREERAS
jgi:hypothetical protein